RMRRALDEYFIGGIASNLGLFREILQDENFIIARMDTGYLDRLLAARQPSTPAAKDGSTEKIAAIAAALLQANRMGSRQTGRANLTPMLHLKNGRWQRGRRDW